MENQRNLFLFLALSVLIFFAWSQVAKLIFPPAPPSTNVVKGRSVPTRAGGAAASPIAHRKLAEALGAVPRIRIASPRLAGSISLRGARIDDLVLLGHRQTIDRNSPPVRLLSPEGTPGAYFAEIGWRGEGVDIPGQDAVWSSTESMLTPDHPVTLTWSNASGQHFAMTIALDREYMFSVRQSLANDGPGKVSAAPYTVIRRAERSRDPSTWTMRTGPIGSFDGSTDYSVSFSDLDKAGPAGVLRSTTGGWIGFGDKYWLAAAVPNQDLRVAASFSGSEQAGYSAGFETGEVSVPTGKTYTYDQRLFAGAKEARLLDRYEDGGIANLGHAIDWGWFIWFEKPLFRLMIWLSQQVGNLGVAIVLLTCLVRLALFPVAQRQFSSMAAMRRLQPKMQTLRERHKDDAMKLQTEMMALYRTEKASPFSGCMPALIQMPIFLALYKVLSLSIEMRHAPFTLWIKDLSAPDPLTPVNLFGFLPFNPPSFLHIGMLAIILGLTFAAQLRLSPVPPDPRQQQVMRFMPWMMTIFFAPLAAGLQLYYVANNLLSVAQQQWFQRRSITSSAPSRRKSPEKRRG